MPATRVVPPFKPRALLTLAAVLGALTGASLTALFVYLTTQYRSLDALIPGIIILAHIVLLPPLMTGLLLARITQHPRTTTRVGLAFGVAQAAGLLAYSFVASETGSATAGPLDLLGLVITLTLLSTLAWTMFHLARFLTRALLFTTAEQTGALCYRCGYDRGGPAVPTCPECATPDDFTTLRGQTLLRLAALAQRLARPAAAALLIIFLVAAANTVATRTIPTARFIRTFRSEHIPISNWFITPPGWPNWHAGSRSTPAVAAWVPFPDGSTRVVLVLYAPSGGSPDAAMQLAVAAKPDTFSRHQLPDHGSTHIALDLPRALAERTARDGLPESLLNAIADLADSKSWQPTGAGFTTLIVDPEIDPAPHFLPQ